MSRLDPFSSRFEVFGREARQVVPDINGDAFELLRERLSPEPGEDGRVILLKAPRAGYGKTLLIQRVSEALVPNHHFVKVGLIGGRTIEASHVLECVLESLCQLLPAADGLTTLDLVARKIIARGLEPLVRSGEVPCQDRDGALVALQQSPVETFDFHHEKAVTAHWTEANFEILGPRLAAEIAEVSGASLREAAYWVELFFRFASTSPENVERSRLLFETVFRPEGLRPSDSGAGERLHGLLSLMSIATSVVLVIDDTEGLSTHPPDALELASFLTNLAQTCPGTMVLLSVNNDVWDTAFAPRLPGGLADRLTEHQVSLRPLDRAQAEEIIRSRGGPHASDVLERMEWGEGELYARRVLKEASVAWDALARESATAEAVEEAPDDAFGTLTDLAVLGAVAPDEVEEEKEIEPEGAAPDDSGSEGETTINVVESGDEVEDSGSAGAAGESSSVEEDVADAGAEVPPAIEPAAPASLSPAAAALLAARDAQLNVGRPTVESAPAESKGEGATESAGSDPDKAVPFEAASYATPATPLTADPGTGAEAPGLSPISKLANPIDPLVEDDARKESSPEPESPFTPATASGASVFAPVESSGPETQPTEDSESEEAEAGSGSPPVTSPEGSAEVPPPVRQASPFTPEGAGSSPFSRVWEQRAEESEAAEPEPSSDDVWAEQKASPPPPVPEPVAPESSAPSAFSPANPTAPEVDAEDAEDIKREEQSAAAPSSPFERVDPPEPVMDISPPADPPKPSPFSPVSEAPKTEEASAPPAAPSQERSSPFSPVTPPSGPVSTSPFSPAASSSSAPPPAIPPSAPPEAKAASEGDSASGQPADPFESAKESPPSEDRSSAPSSFKPVGEGGLPPKRSDSSPFAPVEKREPSTFQKQPTPEVSTNAPATPPPLSEKAATEDKPPSPFSPAEPPVLPPKAASPFAPADKSGTEPVGRPPVTPAESREDEDKVDELLRQFKERYGRD